jgi:hypothetical protein
LRCGGIGKLRLRRSACVSCRLALGAAFALAACAALIAVRGTTQFDGGVMISVNLPVL